MSSSYMDVDVLVASKASPRANYLTPGKCKRCNEICIKYYLKTIEEEEEKYDRMSFFYQNVRDFEDAKGVVHSQYFKSLFTVDIPQGCTDEDAHAVIGCPTCKNFVWPLVIRCDLVCSSSNEDVKIMTPAGSRVSITSQPLSDVHMEKIWQNISATDYTSEELYLSGKQELRFEALHVSVREFLKKVSDANQKRRLPEVIIDHLPEPNMQLHDYLTHMSDIYRTFRKKELIPSSYDALRKYFQVSGNLADCVLSYCMLFPDPNTGVQRILSSKIKNQNEIYNLSHEPEAIDFLNCMRSINQFKELTKYDSICKRLGINEDFIDINDRNKWMLKVTPMISSGLLREDNFKLLHKYNYEIGQATMVLNGLPCIFPSTEKKYFLDFKNLILKEDIVKAMKLGDYTIMANIQKNFDFSVVNNTVVFSMPAVTGTSKNNKGSKNQGANQNDGNAWQTPRRSGSANNKNQGKAQAQRQSKQAPAQNQARKQDTRGKQPRHVYLAAIREARAARIEPPKWATVGLAKYYVYDPSMAKRKPNGGRGERSGSRSRSNSKSRGKDT